MRNAKPCQSESCRKRGYHKQCSGSGRFYDAKSGVPTYPTALWEIRRLNGWDELSPIKREEKEEGK